MTKLEKGTFYRSYYEAGKYMPDAEKLEYYEKVFSYIFDGVETKTTGMVEAVFQAIKPNMKCSRERAFAGKNGGAPAGNQNASKKQAKNKQKTKKEKEKEKEKENSTSTDITNITTVLADVNEDSHEPLKKQKASREEVISLIDSIQGQCKILNIAYSSSDAFKFARLMVISDEFKRCAEMNGMSIVQYSTAILKGSIAIDFWKGPCTGPKDIYLNHAEIYNKCLLKKEEKKRGSENHPTF